MSFPSHADPGTSAGSVDGSGSKVWTEDGATSKGGRRRSSRISADKSDKALLDLSLGASASRLQRAMLSPPSSSPDSPLASGRKPKKS